MTGQFGENAIEFLNGDDKATVSFNKQKYITKIKKLASSRPDEVEIAAENEDGSICAHVPVGWIKIVPKRKYSDEERAEMSRHLAGWAEKQSNFNQNTEKV